MRGRLIGTRDFWVNEIIESLRPAEGSVDEENEDDVDEEDVDDNDEDDEDGGAGQAMTGVTGADCVHEVLSTVCAPASSKCFGFDVLLRDARDTVESFFFLGASHDTGVDGDKVRDLIVGGLAATIDVALGNKV